MNGRPRRLVRCGLAAFLLASARVDAGDDVTADMEAMVRRAFAGATAEEIATRLEQDEVQALCSRYRNRPPDDVAARILESQMRTVRFPDDGRLLGDWREGEKLASIGTGGHIGRIQPDPPDRRKGGNCYACHALAPKEVAAGNLGPGLTGYGRLRGNAPEVVKATFAKVYNAQAFFPCSQMPRFGHNGWLTLKEIADVVAFLLDPASPVNAER
ncbi:MAG: sulfur oxidation c-type cytochrome SoxX [Burkholderiales bacterium]